VAFGRDRQWVARSYQAGDEVGILQLRRLVFGDRDNERDTERHWRWEFRDNPAGHGRIWLAVAADKTVGQYAVIPVRMQHCGEVIVASLSLDTMTHPDYRRQAVFTTLAGKVYEELERQSIPVTYGFPNRNSVEGFISKLDWICVRSLPVFVKPLDASRIVERFITNRILALAARSVSKPLTRLLFKPDNASLEGGGETRWIDRFDDRIDVFWEQVAPKYHIAVVRDSTYLNWRYFDNPGRQYRAVIAEGDDEILAYVILRCMEQFELRGGMIVDLGVLPDRESILGVLLAEAEKFFREQQMDLVACLINGDDEYVGMLRKRGYLPLSKRLGFKEWHFGCRLNTPALDKEFFSHPSNWLPPFEDTDIV
jgi:hypothetical protein